MLPPNEIHVWLDSVEAGPIDLETDLALLSPGELTRYHRYMGDDDRQQFAASHAFLRRTLANYCDQDPDELVFETNQYGRPELAGPSTTGELRFNLSHTRGLTALMIHGVDDAGVDVEAIGSATDLTAIAKTVFAEPELAELAEANLSDREALFYRIWTLKEAYIKARGMGLALPLDKFWFSATPSGDIVFGCQPELDRQPDRWSFTSQKIGDAHFLATAQRSVPGRRLVIKPHPD